MEQKILDKIKDIEKEYNISIILAVESGSRAWGFESKDSDYDVRFIYKKPKDEYLKIVEGEDVIVLPVDNDLDFHGWDIKKALFLMYKSNPSFFEWLNSPIKYVVNDDFKKLKKLSNHYFNPKTAIHHYYSLAESQVSQTVDKQTHVCVKKYLYYIRGLLAAMYIYNKKTPAPVLFQDLLKEIDDLQVLKEIQKLLAIKKQSIESSQVFRNPIIDTYLIDIKKKIDESINLLDKKNNSFDDLDEYFRSVISE